MQHLGVWQRFGTKWAISRWPELLRFDHHVERSVSLLLATMQQAGLCRAFGQVPSSARFLRRDATGREGRIALICWPWERVLNQTAHFVPNRCHTPPFPPHEALLLMAAKRTRYYGEIYSELRNGKASGRCSVFSPETGLLEFRVGQKPTC
jgi:hypothetical protein